MHNLCVIPARGGSKRIPNKNIKLFHGKPIIEYAINAAIDSKLFDLVMVSTDDLTIADIAKKCGADVPFYRSSINSSDDATTIDVINEVVNRYKSLEIQFSNICCIYPCTPLINVKILQKSFEILLNNNYDSLIPILAYMHPIQSAIKINKSNTISFLYPENISKRTQDFEKTYHDAGQFYWLGEKAVSKKKILTENTGYIELEIYIHKILITFLIGNLQKLNLKT